MRPPLKASKTSRRLLLTGGLLVIAGIVAVLRQWPADPPPAAARATIAQTDPGLDLEDPQPSFALLRHVAETGGDEVTRELAVVWLDAQARRRVALSPSYEKWLLAMLRDGGHADWPSEFRFWIYNSAFNNLQYGNDPKAFTQLLRDLALNAPERTMRLYALQHLGLQRLGGQLADELGDQVEADLRQLAAATDGEVAGTAVALLTQWDGEDAPARGGSIERALEIAEDSGRPIDVRVTALHAAGASALPLARRLSTDQGQPIPVRKAAIACIGHHGTGADCAELEELSGESSRLAQAADPALRSIRHRISNPDAPEPVPF
ncbi:hypothetical protein [Haloferula sp. A504]|uniref:hypothetical protein n=1 Tax=Haloferula sp. A504 TaxID=3373601 RepID=UPI0031BFF60B|nr:hypothetical protein [Verrucomicrobiaceae bacterium E54]